MKPSGTHKQTSDNASSRRNQSQKKVVRIPSTKAISEVEKVQLNSPRSSEIFNNRSGTNSGDKNESVLVKRCHNNKLPSRKVSGEKSPLVNAQCFGQRKAEALKAKKSSTRNQDRDISQEIDLAGQTDGLEAAMKISKISMPQNKNDLKRKIAQRRKKIKRNIDLLEFQPVQMQRISLKDEQKQARDSSAISQKSKIAKGAHTDRNKVNKALFINDPTKSVSRGENKHKNLLRSNITKAQGKLFSSSPKKAVQKSMILEKEENPLEDISTGKMKAYMEFQNSIRKTQRVIPSKLPPKLLTDFPHHRPNNKNYVEFLSKFRKFQQRRGQRMSQSLAVISYGSSKELDEQDSQQNKNLPRYPHLPFKKQCLYMSSNQEKNSALEIKKRMLMSKYMHQEFDPIFETDFGKAYFSGIEESDVLEGETIAEMVARLGNYGIERKKNLLGRAARRDFKSEQDNIHKSFQGKTTDSQKPSTVRLNFDSIENKEAIDQYLNKLFVKLNLQPVENHTRESFRSVIECLKKFNKRYHSKKKGPSVNIKELQKAEGLFQERGNSNDDLDLTSNTQSVFQIAMNKKQEYDMKKSDREILRSSRISGRSNFYPGTRKASRNSKRNQNGFSQNLFGEVGKNNQKQTQSIFNRIREDMYKNLKVSTSGNHCDKFGFLKSPMTSQINERPPVMMSPLDGKAVYPRSGRSRKGLNSSFINPQEKRVKIEFQNTPTTKRRIESEYKNLIRKNSLESKASRRSIEKLNFDTRKLEEAIDEFMLNPENANLDSIMANKEEEKKLEESLFYNKKFLEQCKSDNNYITLMIHKMKKSSYRHNQREF
ncbi:unnamed protein product [Moneuplotes crassus]|uniref:Uncharacterized protein n=1 Tax=Euplotes crassus TaxID=5936 RepID=A0AAD2D1U5_EUPCR|nr:unnamed protein product [Moneuplotes crassus]